MSHDGLPARAAIGARAAAADRPTSTSRRLAAIAAFGVVTALALAACSGGATQSAGGQSAAPGGSAPAATASPSGDASVAPSAPAATQATLSFKEANASKIFGGGIVTDLGDGSSAVTIGVVAIGFTDPMPAEIVAGDCATAVAAPTPSTGASIAPASPAASTPPASAGASVAPTPATLPVKLTDIAGGSSNTVVQIGVADLLASPSAVVLHKSAADATVVACADVTASPLAIPRQARRRCELRKSECQATGAQPKRASKRFRKGSVRAISGSSTSACPPRRRHSAIASK